MSKTTAIYTGSFDPFHLGHENLVRRAAHLFDNVIVGVGENPEKASLFSPEERVFIVQEVLSDLTNIEVKSFSGLTVHFARDVNANVLIRGIRALADTEYEFTMSLANATLDSRIETVFLMAGQEFTHISSSLIRQIAKFGGDLKEFVPDSVVRRLEAKFGTVA